MPETDLQQRFDDLHREIGALTSTRSVTAVVRQAHRRRTAGVAVLATATVAAGGTLGSAVWPTASQPEDGPAPAGAGDGELTPTSLDAAAMDAATTSWLGPWGEPDPDRMGDLRAVCTPVFPEPLEPAGGGGLLDPGQWELRRLHRPQ